jgi:uncharacterized protein YcnI
MLSRITRVLGCVVAAGALTIGLAAPALAHVTVNPEQAVQGDWEKLTFRVPNERDNAGTVKLEVTFPTDPPFASVSVKPHPGWKVDVAESKLEQPVKTGDFELDRAVTSITWTAERGVRIEPGQFDEFEVSVGPLPELDSVMFPAVQTYDNGEVVKWEQPMGESGEEPEHPAPLLTLAAAEAGESGHHGETEPAADAEPTDTEPTEPAAASSATDTTARTLGALGLGVGTLCLVVLVFTGVAGRRRGSTE